MRDMKKGNYTENYMFLYGVFIAICIYINVKWLFFNVEINKDIQRVIIFLGDKIFGVYLIHGILMTEYTDWLIVNSYLAFLVETLIIGGSGWLIVSIIKRIPIMKRLL